jgi:ABC-2 type transport system permease protein
MTSRLRASLARLGAILVKEFIQIRRDRLTFAMMFGIPIVQLTLFGYAINSDPKNLPTAVRIADHGPFARSLVRALENSGYFRIVRETASEAEADWLLETGAVQFVLHIPTGFGRDVMRGARPAVLLEVDATDPAATSNAVSAVMTINRRALDHDLDGALANLSATPPPFEVRVQRRYNPEGLTRYNIVPGLLGVVLTMTMVVMTSLAVTRERERGTMEALLAMPVRPLEVMAGKILPYILIGFLQAGVILLAARYLFDVPIAGDLGLLALALVLFIAANLAVGFTFSTAAENQLQAVQMAFFFFLPSLLLSGFMFPFRGMPQWAQWLGEVLPLTHFLRIVRGILLKGNGAAEILPEVWPLLAFLLAAGTVALLRYRQTLD